MIINISDNNNISQQKIGNDQNYVLKGMMYAIATIIIMK